MGVFRVLTKARVNDLRYVVVLSVLISFGFGCSAKTGNVRAPTLDKEAKFEIGELSSGLEEQFDFDVTALFRDSLEESIHKNGLLWQGEKGVKQYQINMRIVDYKTGSAFKRWLMPGWGSTVLAVEGSIDDSITGEKIGEIDHKSSIFAGGFYTTEAWKTIFDTVSAEIAQDLLRRMDRKGFILALDPWAMREMDIEEVDEKRKLSIGDFEDGREEKFRIGERKAAFGVSMGDVLFSRDVKGFMKETLADELRAQGHEIVDGEGGDLLEGRVTKFWIKAPATMLYWDITAEVEMEVTVITAGGTEGAFEKSYACTSEKRTYVYPSNKLMTKVLDACLVDLMEAFREDQI
jgi:hypothetical protein